MAQPGIDAPTGKPDAPPSLLKALVSDLDGTLTMSGRPDDDVLEALGGLRDTGVRVVIATGRILVELLDVFPDVLEHVDALVCEDGAVLVTTAGSQMLADPVPEDLDRVLEASGVPFRRGQVLLATTADAAEVALRAIRELGLDTQLVFNRSELMLLPAAITKGTGTRAALAALGLSPHNAVAVGDAENDHHLLRVCEVAACPSNAVASLKAHGDVLLTGADGLGALELVERLHHGPPFPRSPRWRIAVGKEADGHRIEVPTAGATILVAGAPGAGKSYVAGSIAEQLVEQGYATLVVDPEGDQPGLRHLPGVTWLGGSDLPQRPADLPALLGRPMGSVVLDLSHLPLDARVRWLSSLPKVIARERRIQGSPQWVVLDEAHLVANDPTRVQLLRGDGIDQIALATYRPDLLSPLILDAVTAAVLVGSVSVSGSPLQRLAATMELDAAGIARRLVDVPHGDAVVVRRDEPVVRARLTVRTTPHVRHWHKYATSDASHPFHLRVSKDELAGRAVANLAELHAALLECSGKVIGHHARHGDLSRWLRHEFADSTLADTIAAAEHDTCEGLDPEQARLRICQAINRRYLSW